MSEQIIQEWLSQLDEHLKCPEQNWLLGAGVSYSAKLPLMYPLTRKTIAFISTNYADVTKKIIHPLTEELPEGFHIEHLLSHLGDYTALASRSKNKNVFINGEFCTLEELQSTHELIVEEIAKTIRGGYLEDRSGTSLEEGTPEEPIVCIKEHHAFIDTLFNHAQAGIYERRKAINLFTTNYDTLIEDALALNQVSYWDGFSGGALAYRTLRYGDNLPQTGYRANVIKIHGSIDWYLGPDGGVWRVRDRDIYPEKNKRVLIYPQSTKYIATQQDPFATQFDLFRKSLNSSSSNILGVCGYSFGDDHINNDIEASMSNKNNRTVLIAFVEANTNLPDCLERWRNSDFGKRVLIVSAKGFYIGKEGPHIRTSGYDTWWTFSGVTSLIRNGCAL